VPEPWAHLVFSDQEFCARMKAAGADEGEIREYQSAMNRLPLEHYVAMFSETKALGLATLFRDSWSGVTKPENKDHPFFRAALQRHGEQALLTRGMAAILQKR
jgi:hypothetical protein